CSQWERGANESRNVFLSKFFPKGKRMKDTTKVSVRRATDAMNHK
ncbi:transposase, partial [Lactobacillus crispatus]